MAWAFEHGFLLTDALSAQLDRWVAARPSSWTARTVRGLFWLEMTWRAGGDGAALAAASQRSRDDLERAIELHPKAMVAHAGLVKLHQAREEPREVEASYRRGIAIDGLSVQLMLATLDANQPRYGGSLELTEEIVAAARAREPENPRVARIYGYPHGWRAQRLEWGQMAEQVGARSKLTHRDRDRIIALYSRALRYGEADSEWHYRRAATHRDKGEWSHALADADHALVVAPKAERWWGLKSRALTELARYDEALAAAREGLRHTPDSRDLRWYQGNALHRMGRLDEAAALHRKELALARNEQERHIALSGLGAVLLDAGHYAEAEAALAEVVQLSPGHAMSWHSLGDARWMLGRRDDALEAYERFLAMSAGK
jgi:Flp pilus assembly protein TadD